MELNECLALVVDDSPEALGFIHDALETAGMEVLVALEGKQALSIAQKMKPDVILLDAMMPVMDGFETCRALKKLAGLADTPVIFMTGLSASEDIVRGLEAGGVDYLTKPVKPDELIARLKVHLSNASVTRAAYHLLDESGQVIFAVNDQGHQLWATPQSYTLMGKAGLQGDKVIGLFSRALSQWFQNAPEPGYQMTVPFLEYPLAVKLVSRREGEWVLRLLDGDLPQGADLLRIELDLTGRESEVLYWIANGKTNRETAEILAMSPRTVNKHLEQIFSKLGVDNRTSAAGVALKLFAKAQALA
ncbi:response regulator transcription factor [Reinekea blandensis]|uniref:Two-component transcriptional regulator, LuxR family protein n=1 Tax=Reinekea blandensis MED297 TaxID=314283 RepID=A4BBP7_9GAMM|nr:two-component transcriptional regulator, LuxR family protein [Reinekea sp. MED297] [Reinekea blandensis MED297]